MSSTTSSLTKNEQVWLNSFISGYTRGLSKGQSLELANEILYEFKKKFPSDKPNIKTKLTSYEKELVTKMDGDFK